ncbi:MAG: GNAT family N-acetyltransferase [Rubrobacteraceae bacterium]
MKVLVRQLEDPLFGQDGLGERIGDLRILTHPHIPEVHDLEFYSNFYRWISDHPLSEQARRWVAITDEGEVVGHLSSLPQYYRVNGRRVVAHTPGDYEVNPGYGFYALSLMRAFFRAADNCVACDILPSVIEIEKRLGAEEVGDLNYAAKLLNVSKLPVPPIPARARRLFNLPAAPSPSRSRLPLPGPAKKLLNGSLRALDGALSGAFVGGHETEVVEAFDESFDELFEAVAGVVPCLPEKDAAFLRWRYGTGSPQYPVTVLGVKEGGTLLGYAVLKITTGGIDGYVMDLVALPGRRDVARALIRDAVRFFREAGVHLVRYRYAESTVSVRPEDLRKLGFFHRSNRRNVLLAKFSDPGAQETGRYLSNWAYTLGDGEPSFWMR